MISSKILVLKFIIFASYFKIAIILLYINNTQALLLYLLCCYLICLQIIYILLCNFNFLYCTMILYLIYATENFHNSYRMNCAAKASAHTVICPTGSAVAGRTSVAFKNLPKSTARAAENSEQRPTNDTSLEPGPCNSIHRTLQRHQSIVKVESGRKWN